MRYSIANDWQGLCNSADQSLLFSNQTSYWTPKTLEDKFKIRLPLHTELRLSLGARKAVCLLQIQHAESYANLICVRLRMFITCKEIPRRALSVFSQERQRVAFQAKVCEVEERKERE